MDLIDRAALIASMGLENAVKWGNKDGYQQAHSYSTMMLYEIKNDIDAQPTIEAVPLDKLCELLAEANYVVPCKICEYCDTYDCEIFPCPSTAEEWRNALTKWMEGLDEISE